MTSERAGVEEGDKEGRKTILETGSVHVLFMMEDDGVNQLLGDLVDSLEVDNVLVEVLELDMERLRVSLQQQDKKHGRDRK